MSAEQVFPGVWRHTSTAHSYVVRVGDGTAVLINVGDGSVLDELDALGFTAIAALLTHGQADVAGGGTRLNAAGIPVYAPETDRPLLERPQDFLAAWAGDNNYDGRPLQLCPPAALATLPLHDYRPMTWGNVTFTPRPAPGPTPGHSVLLCELDGQRLAFSGALLCGAGQVPRLSATMWSYNGGEGLAGSILSLLDLADQQPDLLLGAFGPPLPASALGETAGALSELLRLRRHNPRLLELRAQPYRALRPWLLLNRTSEAQSYVLRSGGGRALLIDFGYDFAFGFPPGSGRDARRPWLYTLPALLAGHGIHTIDAALPTHVHDDHVAGIGLLREVYGAQLWAAAPLADVLAQPQRHRLPCRWFGALPPDRVLALEQPVQWEEFQITPYALPGHARHAAALLVEAHGERLLFTGDQYADPDALGLNYTYQNDCVEGDYAASAELIARLRPGLLLSGHWEPVVPDDRWYACARERGETLRHLHATLQPHPSRLLLTTQRDESALHLTLTNPADVAFTGTLAVGPQAQPVQLPPGARADFSVPRQGRSLSIVVRGKAGEPPLMVTVDG